jgi:hypothetical protein
MTVRTSNRQELEGRLLRLLLNIRVLVPVRERSKGTSTNENTSKERSKGGATILGDEIRGQSLDTDISTEGSAGTEEDERRLNKKNRISEKREAERPKTS